MQFDIYSNRHIALQLCNTEEYDRLRLCPESWTEKCMLRFDGETWKNSARNAGKGMEE
jgi:hypothetical protein